MKKPGDAYIHPAFIDSHLHMLGLGQRACTIDLASCRSIAEIQAMIQANSAQPVIIGRGWNQLHFVEKRMLEKADLDKVIADRPVILTRICCHVAVANSVVVDAFREEDNVQGGSVDREKGIFTENALGYLRKYVQIPDREEIKRYFRKADEILLAYGITTVLSDDFTTFAIPYPELIEIINELYRDGSLHVRIVEQVNLPDRESLKSFLAQGYLNKNYGPWRLGPLKLLLDGSLGGRTAWLKATYSDQAESTGISLYDDDSLATILDMANSHGMDCHIHAIGDKAIQQAIDQLVLSLKRTGRKSHRHAIIHAQMADHEQIKALAEHRISAIVQPIFLESDISMLDARIGARKNAAYLFHSMYNNKVLVGFSTDSPVETANPFPNLFAAMKRMSVKDALNGAHLPEEAFTLAEALTCYRENNLYLAYDNAESFKDYIWINQNIETCDAESLRDTIVLETVIDGKTVYKRSE